MASSSHALGDRKTENQATEAAPKVQLFAAYDSLHL